MDEFLENIKNNCKNTCMKHPITIKDIKAVYYLYNDACVSRAKLEEQLHRTTRTLMKINEFINEYIKENKPDISNEAFLKDILNEYLEK